MKAVPQIVYSFYAPELFAITSIFYLFIVFFIFYLKPVLYYITAYFQCFIPCCKLPCLHRSIYFTVRRLLSVLLGEHLPVTYPRCFPLVHLCIFTDCACSITVVNVFFQHNFKLVIVVHKSPSPNTLSEMRALVQTVGPQKGGGGTCLWKAQMQHSPGTQWVGHASLDQSFSAFSFLSKQQQQQKLFHCENRYFACMSVNQVATLPTDTRNQERALNSL